MHIHSIPGNITIAILTRSSLTVTICAGYALSASWARRRGQTGIDHREPAVAEIAGAVIYEADGREREWVEMAASEIHRAELYAGSGAGKERRPDSAAKIARLEERIQELERHISPEPTPVPHGTGSHLRF